MQVCVHGAKAPAGSEVHLNVLSNIFINSTPLSYLIRFFFNINFAAYDQLRDRSMKIESQPPNSKCNQHSFLSPFIVSLPFQSAEGKRLHSISVNIVWSAVGEGLGWAWNYFWKELGLD